MMWTHTFGERTCPICGTTFIARQSVSKYCGGTCQVKSYQKRYEHVRGRRKPERNHNMQKVKNIYYTTDPIELGTDSGYPTGLVIELQDGTMLRHQSDSPLMPWQAIKATKPKEDKER